MIDIVYSIMLITIRFDLNKRIVVDVMNWFARDWSECLYYVFGLRVYLLLGVQWITCIVLTREAYSKTLDKSFPLYEAD